MNKTVVIGMSGGVDSSVAAYLLKKQGYNVIGVTMKVWGEDCNEKFQAECGDAKKVAEKLGIPHFVVDFREEFKKSVMEYFASEYTNGRTPNPCVVCNRKIKWKALMSAAKEQGADLIATGHYATIKELPNGRLTVSQVAGGKDQSYVLYNLTQDQLRHTIMPLGEYTKDQIRSIANEIGIDVANKPDSQEICFIPDDDYVRFLKDFANYKPVEGDFVYRDGTVLGKHKGIVNYTIGQRKGLGIAYGHHIFVSKIDAQSNTVFIGEDEDIRSTKLIANDVNFMGIETITEPIEVIAKIRYAHKGSRACASFSGGKLILEFEEPVRAITPGQAVVLYDTSGEMNILGGGIIE